LIGGLFICSSERGTGGIGSSSPSVHSPAIGYCAHAPNVG